MNLSVTSALLLVLLSSAGLPSSLPVWNGHWASWEPPNLCAVAMVRTREPGSRLNVRPSPTTRFAAIGALADGQRVYSCNEYRSPSGVRWYGVFYAGPGRPCHGGTAEGLDIRLSPRCRSGWVDRRWLELISG